MYYFALMTRTDFLSLIGNQLKNNNIDLRPLLDMQHRLNRNSNDLKNDLSHRCWCIASYRIQMRCSLTLKMLHMLSKCCLHFNKLFILIGCYRGWRRPHSKEEYTGQFSCAGLMSRRGIKSVLHISIPNAFTNIAQVHLYCQNWDPPSPFTLPSHSPHSDTGFKYAVRTC